MKALYRIVLLVLVLSLTVPLTACGGSNGVNQETPQATAKPTVVGIATPADNNIASDIPVMVGARDIRFDPDGISFSYLIDRTLNDVALFYQEALPLYNWELGIDPDASTGAMAALKRVNENHDQVIVSLSWNTTGLFTIVHIGLTRGQ